MSDSSIRPARCFHPHFEDFGEALGGDRWPPSLTKDRFRRNWRISTTSTRHCKLWTSRSVQHLPLSESRVHQGRRDRRGKNILRHRPALLPV